MYTKFSIQNLELKLIRTIHHVESERNYSTTFSVTYPDTEFFSTTVPEPFGSYLTVVPKPFNVNSEFAEYSFLNAFLNGYTLAIINCSRQNESDQK